MKKITTGVLLICMAILLFGCSGRDEEQLSRMDGVLGLFGSAASEDKCVYVEDWLLHIQDIATNQSMVFCSKPDCKHEPWDEETNPDPECEAALRPGCMDFESVGLYKDKVYAFEDSAKKANEMTLYSKALDGQGWSKIAEIPYGVSFSARGYYVNGYAYIAGAHVENPSCIGEPSKERCVILKVNLSNGKYEKLGTEYAADYWCRMEHLDYSNGMLCYEVTQLKEGYTDEDVANLSGEDWELILDVTVAVVDAKTGEEEKLDFRGGFLYGEYVCYHDGLLYYKEGHVVARWDVEHHSDASAIGEYEEGATVRNYPPIGIMIDNGTKQRIYDIKKSRWKEVENPDGTTTTASRGILNYNSQYVRATGVIGDMDKDGVLIAKWVTWEDYIAGTWLPGEKGSDMVVIASGQDEDLADTAHAEPVLDDAYYAEHWKGKTILTWWDVANLPAHVIAKLNDTLVEKGKDYVLRANQVEYYDDEYFDALVDAKNNRESVDIFITPTEMEGEQPENKYKKCADAGLMEPLDAFLASDKGEEFYRTFYEKQWEAMKVDGKIYSYDYRSMPVQDVCMLINQEYIDKYHLTIDDNTTMADVFQMAQEVAEKEKNEDMVPILWAMGTGESSVRETPVDGLEELRDKYKGKGLFHFWDATNTNDQFTFFAEFVMDDLAEWNDEEGFVNIPNRHIQKCKKITVQRGSYFPVTNGLTAVAAWSEHKEEAMDFIAAANTDKDIATILQFGEEGWDYTLEDGRIQNCEESITDICNKWITPPYQLEPDDKEQTYRSYMEEHLKD